MPKAGWKLEIQNGKYDTPFMNRGASVTDGVTMVTHRRRVARILTAAGRDLARLDLFLDGSALVGRVTLTPPALTQFSLASDRAR